MANEEEGTTSSAPVSTGEFTKFKSSLDAMFDEMKNLILSMQNTTSTSASPPPTYTTTKVQGFVAASKNSNGVEDAGNEEEQVEEEVPEDEDGDNESFHTTKPKPHKGNGTGVYSAIRGPTYTGSPLASPHYAHVGNPPMLDASSFANWKF